jgi:hypothetical protein
VDGRASIATLSGTTSPADLRDSARQSERRDDMRLQLRLLTVIATLVCASCGGGGGGGGEVVDPPLPFLVLSDFQSAAVVVGQPTPTASSQDAGGASPNAVGIHTPLGAAAGGLFVVDSYNHRVLGFNGIPTAHGEAAAFILGQPDVTSNAPGTTASRFRFPSKAVVAGGRLFLADTSNNRVLIWDQIPTSNVPADHVVGQASFANGTANDDDQDGTSDPTPSARTLSGPYGIAVAGGRLFVADTNNHRVLMWNSIPDSNFVPADGLLGQFGDFTLAVPGTSDVQFQYPNDVAVGGGHLFVADTLNHRVLVWLTAPPAFAIADLVLGQPGFVSSTPGAGSTDMTFPYAVHASDSQLFIADYANHRVLVYDAHPTSIRQAADHVLGQSNFANTTINDDDQNGTMDATPSGRTMSEPTGISGFGNRLFVSEYSNHRILIFESP